MTTDPRFADLITPSLLLDETKMMQNIDRLADHAKRLGGVASTTFKDRQIR